MSAFLENFQTTKLELQTIKIVLGDKKIMITLRAPAHCLTCCWNNYFMYDISVYMTLFRYTRLHKAAIYNKKRMLQLLQSFSWRNSVFLQSEEYRKVQNG